MKKIKKIRKKFDEQKTLKMENGKFLDFKG